MDLCRAAGYAFHNCEFKHVLQIVRDAAVVRPELAELHLKALGELDDKVAALAQARAYTRIFPKFGALHYYVGMSAYLAGQTTGEIEPAFKTAAALGYEGSHLGLAFVAFVHGQYEAAISHLETGDALASPELEHVRRLMLFQVQVANKDLDSARLELVAADRILARHPSMLRSHWGHLCWVRYLRATEAFASAKTLVERLLALLDPELTPRLYRNASEARRLVDERSPKPNIVLPPSAVPAAIGKKPMLNSLYAFLTSMGSNGASKERIAQTVWEETYNPAIHDDRIYKTIARLRKLLGDDQATPSRLVQRGRHYVLNTPAVAAPEGEP